METITNRTFIRESPQRIFATVANIELYPKIFTSCLEAHSIERVAEREVFEMRVSNRLGENVVRSQRHNYPAAGRIEFQMLSMPTQFKLLCGWWSIAGRERCSEIVLVHEFELSSELRGYDRLTAIEQLRDNIYVNSLQVLSDLKVWLEGQRGLAEREPVQPSLTRQAAAPAQPRAH